MEERKLIKQTGGEYTTQRNLVVRTPVKNEYDDGTVTHTMGFIVCEVHNEDNTVLIAKMLNDASRSFDYYEEELYRSAIYRHQGEVAGLSYIALKLAGEAGEFAEKVGKLLRDTDAEMNDISANIEIGRKIGIVKELGDILWYVVAACHELKVPLSNVFARELEKVTSRKSRGTLHGDGDNR